jgi:hypothetical protein
MRSKKVFQLAKVLLEHNHAPEVIPTSIEQRYLSMKILKMGRFSSSRETGGHGIANFLHVMRFH